MTTVSNTDPYRSAEAAAAVEFRLKREASLRKWDVRLIVHNEGFLCPGVVSLSGKRLNEEFCVVAVIMHSGDESRCRTSVCLRALERIIGSCMNPIYPQQRKEVPNEVRS